MNKFKDGLYRPRSRVIDHLVEIRILGQSENGIAVKYAATYGDYFMKSETVVSWLKVEHFEQQFEFVDSLPPETNTAPVSPFFDQFQSAKRN